jgi:hypothetical protein
MLSPCGIEWCEVETGLFAANLRISGHAQAAGPLRVEFAATGRLTSEARRGPASRDAPPNV